MIGDLLTMNNDLLTVKEVADITGLTKQNIYQQLSTNLKNYVVDVGNKKMLKSLIITEYYKIDLNKEIKKKSSDNFKKSQTNLNEKSKVFKVKSSYSSGTDYIVEFFKEEIKIKNEQLLDKEQTIKEKDKKINELTEKITDLTERLAVLFENSQQLQKNQQLLEAKTIIADETEPDAEKKKGWIWRRKNKKEK